MTLFGFSEYQARAFNFYLRQRQTNNLRFSDKYWLAGIVFGLVFGSLLLTVGRVFFRNNAAHMVLFIVIFFGAATFGLAPIQIRMWKQWYHNLSPTDKKEFWWIQKRRLQYTALVTAGFIMVIAYLFVEGIWLS